MNNQLRRIAGGIGILTCFCGQSGFGAESFEKPQSSSSLTDLDLTELMNVPITTVSRKAESAWKTAAAIHVITQEDIHRSGATTIPEALRLAPGLNVAQIDSRNWAVSSRGFNDFFANKLLVLMDGRSVYTPLFSGVFWDVQDTLLEDIERIEVIRGPGASLWGANAVNGIINIITKSAKDSQGTLISAGAGTEERGFGTIRHGGMINEWAFYRVYAKYNNRDESRKLNGTRGVDDWDVWRGGFRLDLDPWQKSNFTVQGDVYSGSVGQSQTLFTPLETDHSGDGRMSGGNLLGNWRHEFSADSDFSLSLYYDRTDREDTVHHEVRDTGDVDFQHRLQLGERHDLMWGLGYRNTRDDISDGRKGSRAIMFSPGSQSDQLFSTFLQDDITLIEDKLRLTVGSKFEHNDYTDFEWQPSGRVSWTPTEQHTLWGAVSRAVRTPARFEHTVDAWFLPIPPGGSKLVGNPEFTSEKVIAYELGYRIQPLASVSLDLATFYNDYEDLRTIDLSRPFPFPVLFQPNNRMEGESYGFELAGNWKVVENWRLSAGYTFLRLNLHQRNIDSFSDEAAEGDAPRNQVFLRSYLDLPHNVQFDLGLSYVDQLDAGVESYWKLDARVGWKPLSSHDLEFSIVGQNLLDKRHSEFRQGFLVVPHEIERSVYGKVTYRF